MAYHLLIYCFERTNATTSSQLLSVAVNFCVIYDTNFIVIKSYRSVVDFICNFKAHKSFHHNLLMMQFRRNVYGINFY